MEIKFSVKNLFIYLFLYMGRWYLALWTRPQNQDQPDNMRFIRLLNWIENWKKKSNTREKLHNRSSIFKQYNWKIHDFSIDPLKRI